ncbi:MAG: hypothetical protein WC707_06090 [Candidatus Babeliaceae bacterium]|jgi:hypothetical protein
MKNILLRMALLAMAIAQFHNTIVAQEATQAPQASWWKRNISEPIAERWASYPARDSQKMDAWRTFKENWAGAKDHFRGAALTNLPLLQESNYEGGPRVGYGRAIGSALAEKWRDPGALYDRAYGELLTRSPWLQERNVEAGYDENEPTWREKIKEDVKRRAFHNDPIAENYLENALQDPDARSRIFQEAANHKNVNLMRRILRDDPSLVDAGLGLTNITPLYVAIRDHKPEAVAFLLEKGADVNARVADIPGYGTPLASAESNVDTSQKELNQLRTKMLTARDQEKADLAYQIGAKKVELGENQNILNMLREKSPAVSASARVLVDAVVRNDVKKVKDVLAQGDLSYSDISRAYKIARDQGSLSKKRYFSDEEKAKSLHRQGLRGLSSAMYDRLYTSGKQLEATDAIAKALWNEIQGPRYMNG